MTNQFEYGHIALVEDDNALAQLTADFLGAEGYRITLFDNGIDAASAIPEIYPDCVLLDIMLPGLNGIEVCRQIRKAYNGPIIFLTAKGDPMDEILGLELGADDYLAKPIEPRLLLAHIRAQLRRMEREQPDTQKTPSTFEISDTTETISFQSQPLNLTQPEFLLLKLFLQSNGEIISRDQVMLAIRGIEHDGLSRTVDILVSDLRKKIPDPEWIKTVRGKGYVWHCS